MVQARCGWSHTSYEGENSCVDYISSGPQRSMLSQPHPGQFRTLTTRFDSTWRSQTWEMVTGSHQES